MIIKERYIYLHNVKTCKQTVSYELRCDKLEIPIFGMKNSFNLST